MADIDSFGGRLVIGLDKLGSLQHIEADFKILRVLERD